MVFLPAGTVFPRQRGVWRLYCQVALRLGRSRAWRGCGRSTVPPLMVVNHAGWRGPCVPSAYTGVDLRKGRQAQNRAWAESRELQQNGWLPTRPNGTEGGRHGGRGSPFRVQTRQPSASASEISPGPPSPGAAARSRPALTDVRLFERLLALVPGCRLPLSDRLTAGTSNEEGRGGSELWKVDGR